MQLEIQHQEANQRFVVELEGGAAHLFYRRGSPRVLDYLSTYVPPQHRHRQIGEHLVRHALDYARANRYEVIPTCSFVQRVVDRFPQYRDLIAAG